MPIATSSSSSSTGDGCAFIGLSFGAMVGWRDGGASCEDGLLCYTLWFWYPSPPMSTPGLGTGKPLLTILNVLVVFSPASVNSIDADAW